MRLKDIDTSKFLEDPNKDDFVSRMIERSPVFKFDINRVNQKKALIYISLVYDKESYFRKDVKEYVARKYKSGLVAGFILREDGTFDRDVEKVMLGENDCFNKAVVQYVAMQYDIEYARLVVYEHNYYKFSDKAMKSIDDRGELKKRIDELSQDIEMLEEKVFGGTEVLNMRKALYEGTARTRTKLRIEDKVDEYKLNGLKDISPYGKDYKQEFPTFVGDKLPKDDAQVPES